MGAPRKKLLFKLKIYFKWIGFDDAKYNTGKAGCGGVARDEDGN